PPELVSGLVARLVRLGVLDRLRQTGEEIAAIAADLGGVTLADPVGAAIVSQAARHAIDGNRWGDIEPDLAAVALGRMGPLRGPVAGDALAAARDAAGDDVPAAIDLDEVHRLGPGGLSEEDLVLWAQFPESVERLARRRMSLSDDADAPITAPGLDRTLLETLVDVVEGAGDAEVQVEVGGARVTVRRAAPVAVPVGGAAAPGAPAAGEGLIRVESPIVGTFYRAPSPEADPFVKPGDRVEAGQTLCLIEAMKLFNEISSAVGGVVKEITADNEEPVEFGQLLFVIDPS
ncbi:MAG: biotin/lipoyl-containing protein, partial [Actinomycetota bacterium]